LGPLHPFSFNGLICYQALTPQVMINVVLMYYLFR